MAKAAQDGPHRATSPVTEDPFRYLDTSGPEWTYLGHFRGDRFVREGHNEGMRGMGKVGKVMHEFKEGELRSGSGQKVTSRKQAMAIGLSEARRAGAKIPKRRGY